MNRSSDSDSGFFSSGSSESYPSSPDSSSNASSSPPPNMQHNDQLRQGALGAPWYGSLFNFMEYLAAQRLGNFYNANTSGLGGAALAPGMGGVVDCRAIQGNGVLGAYGFGGNLYSGFQPHFNYPLGAGAVLGNYGVVGAPGLTQSYINRLHERPGLLPVQLGNRAPLHSFNEVPQGYANLLENAQENRLPDVCRETQSSNAQENRLPNVCRETHSSSSNGESHDSAPVQLGHAESIEHDHSPRSSVRPRTDEVRTVSDGGEVPVSGMRLQGSTRTESEQIFKEESRAVLEGEPGTSHEVDSVTISESQLRTVPEIQTGESFESQAVTSSEIQPGTSAASQPGPSQGNSHGMRRCLICDYLTPDMNDLMVHIDVHFSVPTYLCADCIQMFRSKEELQTHQCPCRDK